MKNNYVLLGDTVLSGYSHQIKRLLEDQGHSVIVHKHRQFNLSRVADIWEALPYLQKLYAEKKYSTWLISVGIWDGYPIVTDLVDFELDLIKIILRSRRKGFNISFVEIALPRLCGGFRMRLHAIKQNEVLNRLGKMYNVPVAPMSEWQRAEAWSYRYKKYHNNDNIHFDKRSEHRQAILMSEWILQEKQEQ